MTPEDVVERAALAIAEFYVDDATPQDVSTLVASGVDVVGMARAVIAAMREPTDEMLEAAYYAGDVSDNGGAERADFADEWRAAVNRSIGGEGAAPGVLALVRPYR